MPLYARLHPNGPFFPRPFRIPDLMSQRQWRDNPVAREVLPEAGDQLGVMLGAHNGAMRNVVLTRSGRTFTDRQRDLLSLTLRHVTAAVERAGLQGSVGLQTMPQPQWAQFASQCSGEAAAPADTVLEHSYARLGVPNRAAAVARLTRPRGSSPEHAPPPGAVSSTLSMPRSA